MTEYCWGKLNKPYLVLEKTSTHYKVEVLGQVPIKKIIGSCEWPYKVGDRVRVLMGYSWQLGTVGKGLSVVLDNGKPCPIRSDNNVRPLYVPLLDRSAPQIQASI